MKNLRTRHRGIRGNAVVGSSPAILLLLWTLCHGFGVEKTIGANDYYAEFDDPYYAAAGVYIALTAQPMPSLDSLSEGRAYLHLARRAVKPTFLLLEAGVYPLPLAGAAAKAWAPSVYRTAVIADVNVIRMVTESVSFKEPWSVSVFLGNVARFRGQDSSFQGRGNVGLLCSYGYYHLKDNSVYPDHWGEVEVKMKIDKSSKEQKFATSCRAGFRLHSNPDIRQVAYVALRRNRTDFAESRFSLIKNTNLELRTDLALAPLQLARVSLQGGKKFPFRIRRRPLAIGLSLGAAWEVNNTYRGRLAEGFARNSLSPVITPMVSF